MKHILILSALLFQCSALADSDIRDHYQGYNSFSCWELATYNLDEYEGLSLCQVDSSCCKENESDND